MRIVQREEVRRMCRAQIKRAPPLPSIRAPGRRVRLTAHTAVTLGDVLGLFAHGESSRDGGRLSAGAKLVSWPGLVAGLGVYTLIAIIPET